MDASKIIDLTVTDDDDEVEEESSSKVCAVHGGNPITMEHQAILSGPCWLTDEIINAYGVLLSKEHSQNYYFSSFFYERLSFGNPAETCFASRKRIFFPINLHQAHWALAVLDVPQRRLLYYDSMMNRRTGMRVLETIHGKFLIPAFPSYAVPSEKNKSKKKEGSNSVGLLAYLMTKMQMDSRPTDEIKLLIPPGQPQQQDGYSCGSFVCKWMQVLSSYYTKDPSFSPADVALHRRSMWALLTEKDGPE